MRRTANFNKWNDGNYSSHLSVSVYNSPAFFTYDYDLKIMCFMLLVTSVFIIQSWTERPKLRRTLGLGWARLMEMKGLSQYKYKHQGSLVENVLEFVVIILLSSYRWIGWTIFSL